MPNLDEIRAEHVKSNYDADDDICLADRQEWPCDTAIVLAALDAALADVDAWYGAALMAADERDAALARERRLREAAAALDRAYGAVPLGGMSEMTKERLAAWARLQDAVETPEAGS